MWVELQLIKWTFYLEISVGMLFVNNLAYALFLKSGYAPNEDCLG